MRNRRVLAVTCFVASGLLIGAGAAGPAAAAGASGALDPGFGSGGITITDTGVFGDNAHDAALQANGDIVVSTDLGVWRYLPGGTLDSGFGSAGFAANGFQDGGQGGADIAVQPDGKIIWVGNTGDPTLPTNDFAIARFTANGALDSGFGTGGRATAQFFAQPLQGAMQEAFAVVVQPDGKILVGGTARQGQNKRAPFQGAMVRLNPNGSLDSSFGAGGRVLDDGSSVGSISALGLDAAGDIFVLPAHREFSPTGHLDATTAPAAITAASHGNSDAFLPSGQYLSGTAVGVAKHDVDVQVRRFNADGSLASSSAAFDYSGATGLDQARDGVGAVAVQPNGQAVVGGSSFLGTDLFNLARVNPDGSLDAAFGAGGSVSTNIAGGFGYFALLVQPDGKIVAIGSGETGGPAGPSEIIVARYSG